MLSKQPTIQNVVPAFYLLRNVWNQKISTDNGHEKCLKKEFYSWMIKFGLLLLQFT